LHGLRRIHQVGIGTNFFMYEITNELNEQGFSINPSTFFLERNDGNNNFNTLDFYVIHIILQEAKIAVNNVTYELPAGSLVFIGPSKDVSVHDGYDQEEAVYVIAFSLSFYDRSIIDGLLLNSELFFNFESDLVISPASLPTAEIKKLIIDRLNLYKSKNNLGFYIATAHNCVEALLLDGLLHVEENQSNKDNYKKFTSFDVVNRFRALLQKNFKSERKVSYYADKLYVTPRRLTKMTEEILGKSAKQLIIEKVVNESSILLQHSAHTVSEIAYTLGFNDEGNFSNFIKTHTLKSPKEIRENRQ